MSCSPRSPCAVTLADTALDFFLPARAALAVPFHAVAMLGMSCALLGRALLFGAMYDTFRVAAVGEPDLSRHRHRGRSRQAPRQRTGLFALRAA